MKKLLLIILASIGVFVLAGCNDADVASNNLSQDADNFKILRKVTFINTITGEDEFQKHFLGLSPTTVYIVEQQEWTEANQYRFKITLKPSALIPDVEVR